jgi:DNA topoisomerase-3
LISKGKSRNDAFLKKMREYAAALVSSVAASTATYVHDNITREKCPDCGKFLLEVKGKKGLLRICPDRECGYRKNLSVQTNARCPNCNKRLELRGDGDKRTFFCVCGHRERLAEFEKRRVDSGATKHAVKDFLRAQEERNSAPKYSPIAAKLAKLMEEDKK